MPATPGQPGGPGEPPLGGPFEGEGGGKETRGRTALLLALVLAGAVVAAAGLWSFVLRSKPVEEAKPAPAVTATTRARVVASPKPSASPSAVQTGVPETFEVFEGRDPFRPLLVAASSPAPGATTSTTTSSTPAPGRTSEASSQVGQRVTLMDVFTQGGTTYASVKVGSTVYKVKAGDTFAESFKVVSLSDRCGTFLYGDSRFRLCEGEEVIK